MGLLVARVALATVFLYTGVQAIQHTGHTAVALGAMGYPVPRVLAIVAALAELAGGLSLLLGALTPLGCIALILFLLPTTYSFHLPGLLRGDSRQAIETFKNLAIVGGLIAMMFSGPGSFSVDARMSGGSR